MGPRTEKEGKNFVFLKYGEFPYCGKFLQNVVNLVGVVNLAGVVNEIETHQSAAIRNGNVLPYSNVLYIVN